MGRVRRKCPGLFFPTRCHHFRFTFRFVERVPCPHPILSPPVGIDPPAVSVRCYDRVHRSLAWMIHCWFSQLPAFKPILNPIMTYCMTGCFSTQLSYCIIPFDCFVKIDCMSAGWIVQTHGVRYNDSGEIGLGSWRPNCKEHMSKLSKEGWISSTLCSCDANNWHQMKHTSLFFVGGLGNTTSDLLKMFGDIVATSVILNRGASHESSSITKIKRLFVPSQKA